MPVREPVHLLEFGEDRRLHLDLVPALLIRHLDCHLELVIHLDQEVLAEHLADHAVQGNAVVFWMAVRCLLHFF